MRKIILAFGLSLSVIACTEEKPKEEGINISVNDDSTNATVNVGANGINIQSNDGKSADVKIDENGIKVIKPKNKFGSEANQ